MEHRDKTECVVVGGGLVGCLIAICLARRGYRLAVYERRPDPRTTSDSAPGASINLTLCVRGLKSLEYAGVLESVRDTFTPVYGRLVHLEDGRVSYQAYGDSGDAIYCVKRRDLNIGLLEIVESLGVPVHFTSRCVDIEPSSRRVTFQDAAGMAESLRPPRVIATDGARSTIRSRLHDRGYLKQYVQVSTMVYKTAEIPAQQAECRLQEGAIHVWPRKQCLGLAFPNRDGSYSVALHAPSRERQSLIQIADEVRLRAFLEANFSDLPLPPVSARELLAQNHRSMLSVHCQPWWIDEWIVLMGDAAHAILPHYGQGANAGFEDCRLFDALIDRYGGNWNTLCEVFEQTRRPNMEAVAALCSEHQNNLHYFVDSPEFHLRLEIERRLHELFPLRVIPLYTMLSFSDIPYAEVQVRDRVQRDLVADLMSNGGVEQLLEQQTPFVESIRRRVDHDLPPLLRMSGVPKDGGNDSV